MKLKDLLTAIVLLPLTMIPMSGLFAQAWDWTTPAPASDSVSDNRNAILEQVLYNGDYAYMLFWERSEDPGSTSIYCRNMYEMDEPSLVVTGENFHCTNPRIINTNFYDDDTLFYLFYQSDQNGNSDIYYKVYTPDGFTEPALFAGTASDETHFRCNENGIMTWQEGDKIKTAQLYKYNSPFIITDPITIDSVNCSMPELSIGYYYAYVFWLKQQNDSSLIFIDNWDGSMPEPQRLSGAGEITSLRFGSGTCMDEADVISWESIDNGVHKIHAMTLYNYDEFVSNFQQDIDFSPAFAVYYIPVEEFYESGLLTFIYGTDQDNDVYLCSEEYYISPDIENYMNLSSSPYDEANPVFFQGEDVEYPWKDMYLIWESERSGKWQLFYSHKWIFCGGGISEVQTSIISGLNIFPNPVKSTCDIRYTLSERSDVSIQLCTPDGKQVTLMDKTIQEKGEQVYKLDFERILPGSLFSGVYLIKVQAGNNIVSGKIIRVK